MSGQGRMPTPGQVHEALKPRSQSGAGWQTVERYMNREVETREKLAALMHAAGCIYCGD
jgi:hypothetical protein